MNRFRFNLLAIMIRLTMFRLMLLILPILRSHYSFDSFRLIRLILTQLLLIFVR